MQRVEILPEGDDPIIIEEVDERHEAEAPVSSGKGKAVRFIFGIVSF